MVNFGLNPAAILGLFLAVAGAGLFFLRSIRPELARDYDIFFAAVGLLCGIILLFNGWRLDPILQFGQFLLTGTAIFFAFESIRMRSVATEQARRNTPIVDRDRPVSRTRVYTEAELDKIDPYDDPYNNVYDGAEPNYSSPRLRGYDDPQPRTTRRPNERRRPSPSGDVRDEPRRRPSRNRSESENYGDRYGERGEQENRDLRSRRRPNQPPTNKTNKYDNGNAQDDWGENSRPTPRRRQSPSREDRYSEPTPSTTRRRSSPGDLGRSYDDEPSYGNEKPRRGYNADLGRSYEPEEDESSIPGDYVVDYQPVNDTDTDPDYSDSYDDRTSDNYDDYEDEREGNLDDEYDDYSDRPERRTPIDFDKYDR